ncbi:unnamed protein product [Clavelina lepadiformis]|uniref:Plus3 domain-containing protein n=1 Tax=Clavelina lepadiformis TaxID=159417 RepID=A0ABP0FK53_CLALP
MNNKRKNRDFCESNKTDVGNFTQERQCLAAKRPRSGITSSKPEMQTSTINSFDEGALGKEFYDGYDTDLTDLIGHAMDRRRLQNMTEKEREQEFYNRLERRETLQKRIEIEKKLRLAKQQRKEEKHQQKKKPKTSIASFSSSSSQTDPSNKRRIIEKKERNRNLDNLKVERQRKKNKVAKRKLQVSDVSSDDDEASLWRSRFVMKQTKTSIRHQHHTSDKDGRANNVKRQPLLIKDKLSTIRLSRFNLENWIHLPFFKQTVLGCYVRVSTGEEEGRPVYGLAEIVDVVENTTTFQFGNVDPKLGFQLKHGQHTHVINLKFISNSDFTDSEFLKWKKAMEEAGEPLPSLDDIAKKQAAINKAQSYKITDTDIDRIVKENGRSRKTPINYAKRKIDLLRQKEIARSRGDTNGVSRLSKLLDNLEERATYLYNKRQGHLLGVAYLNECIKSDNLQKMEAGKEEWRTLRNTETDRDKMPNSAAKPKAPKVNPLSIKSVTPRRSLTLAEYKKRRGLI